MPFADANMIFLKKVDIEKENPFFVVAEKKRTLPCHTLINTSF